MKKSLLFLIGAFAVSALQAQWVNDPATNTKFATTSDRASEIYLRTHEATGDTYIQWSDSATNEWSVNLQRINASGVPQWGEEGIHIGSHEFETWSPGYALAATSDDNAVTCFRNANDECIAIRFDKDGNALWGEQGISVIEFPEESYGCLRVELQAGTDGGVWVLAHDLMNAYLRYINADGALNPTVTISDEESAYQNGLMMPGPDGTVFVVYKKLSPKQSATQTIDNEIWVASYKIDGTVATAPVQLMESQLFDREYIHNIIPDGIGGGYVFISHDGFNDDGFVVPINTYVFHFDSNGQSTISNLKGVAVHSFDSENHYTDPYATVDPATHDLILVYRQVDVDTQSESRIYANRITTTGEVLWGEGKLIADNEGDLDLSYPTIDAYPDGTGFMISYQKATLINSYTFEAYGYDMDANQTWYKQICSVPGFRMLALNTSGFHNGQNIFAWVSSDGGLYGQNIDMNGVMGPTASVNENENTMTASIFQNGNNLVVSADDLSQVEIISITGQSIKTVKANGNTAEINVNGLTKGLYIVRTNDANGNVAVKKTVIK